MNEKTTTLTLTEARTIAGCFNLGFYVWGGKLVSMYPKIKEIRGASYAEERLFAELVEVYREQTKDD